MRQVLPNLGQMSTSPRLRAAVLDADARFVQALSDRTSHGAWQLQTPSLPAAPEIVAGLRVHAVLLDPSTLGTEAWPYLEKLCARLPEMPVVVCTARASVSERIRGLRLGADDWVTNPCHPDEVIARLEAVVRRREQAAPRLGDKATVVGELQIRTDQCEALVGETRADLTRREFELLDLLAAAEDQVVPREEIYQRVWGFRWCAATARSTCSSASCA